MSVDQVCEDCLLRMKAIFGLMNDDRARAIEDFIGDFDVATYGQAVHEFGVGLCGLEPGFGDAPFAEVFSEECLSFRVAVVLGSNPGFAVENVGVFE